MSRKTVLPPNPFAMNRPAPPPRLTAEQAYALAVQHHSLGRLQESETLLRQILQAHPANAHALHLLGLIAHQAGKPETAIELIGKAIAANGNVALFHVNLCGICRKAGHIAEAIAHGERAVALDPGMVVAHCNLGLAYHDNKEYDKDEACQLRALKLQPTLASALYNMGSIMRERKQVDEAIAYYRRAIAARPDYLEALNNLGGMLAEECRPEEALDVLGKAIRLDPNCILAYCNAGNALNQLERFDAALQHLSHALRLDPDYADTHMTIAGTYLGKDNFADAERAALRALELTADKKAEAHSLLGNIYTQMGETARAAACFNMALELDPELADALLGKGNICMETGELELADHLFHEALKFSSNKLPALCALSQVKKVRAEDQNMTALVAINEQQADTLPKGRLRLLHFALGKCYDDIGDPARAFGHFQEGGRIKRKEMDYDHAAHSQMIDTIIDTFDQSKLAGWRVGGIASALPIFVLGMPRSGTTLTEQIIASHPDVHGAGELPDLMQIFNRATASGDSYPGNIAGLTNELVSAWGNDYVAGLQKKAPDARRITDKMPGNFMALGLIHAMLPNARIVHVMRNPVDNCFSCFSKQFSHGHAYSYDLTELGKYYADYARLMAHWRRVLPEGAFLDVRYEDMVENNEAQARRLIAYCGLEWNDACLESHKTKRSIRTASVTQVRQPIYTSSVDRWRRYETFLKPLLDELGDLV